jgi:acetolactate synthase I/II/III large subunit
MKRASDLFVECLENEGVKYVFGVVGEENLDLMQSLEKSQIEYVSTRHEQAAAFMADVYGRLTGKAGVCISTLGPGATNLITGYADAFLDHSPVVAISAQADLRRMHKESHQYVDLAAVFDPISKWVTTVTTPDIIPEVVRKAFKVAQAEKQGTAFIELPEDVAEMKVDDRKPLSCGKKPQIEVHSKTLKDAADAINESKHPLILVGNGVIRANAEDKVREFVEDVKIPVGNTFMAKGVISSESDMWLGTIGLQARDYIMCGFEKADMVITIGYDFVEYHPDRWNPYGDKKIIHIASVPAEVDNRYSVEVEIVGDINASMRALTKQVAPRKPDPQFMKLKEFITDELKNYCGDNSFPFKPQRILCDARNVLDESDILLSDVGAHKMWIARLFPTNVPNTVLISNGLASMGFAMPGALAAKLVHPDRKVLAICGDGGFMMNMQELETAKRLKSGVVFLIMDDSGYGLIKWKARSKFGENFEYGMNWENPDFIKIAEAFGGIGYLVKKGDDLTEVLRKAFDDAEKGETFAVVDVPVDYSENERLADKLSNLICPI